MKELFQPDLLQNILPRDKACLITNDGSSLTQELVSDLEKNGWTCIRILSFPKSLAPSIEIESRSAETVQLSDTSESTLAAVLEQIQKDSGPVGAFIHLHPSTSSELEDRFPESEQLLLKAVFMLAKHLAHSLIASSADQRAVFMTVTRSNGMLGFGPTENSNLVAGGLNGLVKTAGIEWHPVFCRALDLSPEIKPTEAAEVIQAEMSDSDSRLTEVGQTSGQRFTLVAEESAVTPTGTTGIDDKAVFLVAGGGKGVTAACVVELARRHSCRFILLGRSELQDQEPEWAAGCYDDTELKRRCMEAIKSAGEKPKPMKIAGQLKVIMSDREIRYTMADIQAAGGQVVYLPVDIKNAAALEKALQPATEQLGEVCGIIHGAGVLADTLIEKKTEADFEAVFNTKVSGLDTLLKVVPHDKLAYLILFSSAAGFYGNEAQSDYAAANEVLNKFAHRFKQLSPSCHIIAYNWGPWDGGMVSPELKKIFEERRIDIIPIPVGAAMMAEGLDQAFHDTPQVVIGSSMTIPGTLNEQLTTWHISRKLSLADNPFLQDHAIDKEPVLPFISAVSWMADSCARLYPGYFLRSVEDAQVFKGVVFSDTDEGTFDIEIKEQEKDEAQGHICLGVRVSSPGSGSKPLFHYGSRIFLSRAPAPGAAVAPLTTPPENEPVPYYTNGTLFHGPMFQSITGLVEINEKQLVISCQTPMAAEQAGGPFSSDLFNFFAEDTCLQALLVWARHFHNAGSLPLKIRRAEFFKPVPFGKDFLITLTPEVDTPARLSATVTAHNASGEVYSRFQGAEATISKNLDGKFK